MERSIVAPAVWDEEHLGGLGAEYALGTGLGDAATKYNPTPGTGRTGYMAVPPNNYPFYSEDERYVPVMQADGGQLSEWKPMYQPTPEQAEADRRTAYERGIPHGYVSPGDKYKGLPTITLTVISLLHTDDEYGADVGTDGQHCGGPFSIEVSPKMRVEEVRSLIRDKGGIMPALQRLSYAGKMLEDSQRTLEHYGIAYWHKRFPAWPLKIRRCESGAGGYGRGVLRAHARNGASQSDRSCSKMLTTVMETQSQREHTSLAPLIAD